MVSFIDEHRDTYRIDPICKTLPIAASTYFGCITREADPTRLPHRADRDAFLPQRIRHFWEANSKVYGARKVWQQLKRDREGVARCTVERLTREMGMQGVIRGCRHRTTISDDSLSKPANLVKRDFTATRPNEPWVADLTHVDTWAGFVYVASLIYVFSCKFVGWRCRVLYGRTLAWTLWRRRCTHVLRSTLLFITVI